MGDNMTVPTGGHVHFWTSSTSGKSTCCECGQPQVPTPRLTEKMVAICSWVNDNLFFVNDANKGESQ